MNICHYDCDMYMKYIHYTDARNEKITILGIANLYINHQEGPVTNLIGGVSLLLEA